MTAESAAQFVGALEEQNVDWTRTTSGRFVDTLMDVLVAPAVGAPLPFEELSLPPSVTTAPTPEQLRTAETGVTAAVAGVAAYGSLVIQSRPGGDEPVSLYPERHVAILREGDIVKDVADVLDWLGDAFDQGRQSAVLATGISATADMGATVYGVHGPRAVHVVVVTDR